MHRPRNETARGRTGKCRAVSNDNRLVINWRSHLNKFLAFILLSSLPVIALVSPAQAAEYKVGFVNAAVLLDQAPQSESARKKLEAEFAPREKELVANQKSLRAMEDKLAKDSAVMSESEQRKLERDILSRKREIKNAQDEFREDLNIRRNEELGKLQRSVYEIIVGLAKQEKYDMIVGDGVIYASDTVDITSKVLQRLKDDFKTGGN
jgi:outer membrane protein